MVQVLDALAPPLRHERERLLEVAFPVQNYVAVEPFVRFQDLMYWLPDRVAQLDERAFE